MKSLKLEFNKTKFLKDLSAVKKCAPRFFERYISFCNDIPTGIFYVLSIEGFGFDLPEGTMESLLGPVFSKKKFMAKTEILLSNRRCWKFGNAMRFLGCGVQDVPDELAKTFAFMGIVDDIHVKGFDEAEEENGGRKWKQSAYYGQDNYGDTRFFFKDDDLPKNIYLLNEKEVDYVSRLVGTSMIWQNFQGSNMNFFSHFDEEIDELSD